MYITRGVSDDGPRGSQADIWNACMWKPEMRHFQMHLLPVFCYYLSFLRLNTWKCSDFLNYFSFTFFFTSAFVHQHLKNWKPWRINEQKINNIWVGPNKALFRCGQPVCWCRLLPDMAMLISAFQTVYCCTNRAEILLAALGRNC